MIRNLDVFLWNRKILTERFDRRGGKKLHVQTLAAMNPAADSYESLFDTACRTQAAVSPGCNECGRRKRGRP